jgi:ribosomal protein S18 acetylase RimI-like enzyme
VLTSTIIKTQKELDNLPNIDNDTIINFLYKHLDQFGDSPKAIRECLNYALSEQQGQGGFVVIGKIEDQLAGIVIMIETGMTDYIPEYFLVYVAVNSKLRGQGIGGKLIDESLAKADGDVALHVEYDNPAKRLYERLGFTSKYAEMRYKK